MSGPQGQDPNQQWSSDQPAPQPPASEDQTAQAPVPPPAPEEPTAQAGWHPPAYAPTQYGQSQPFPSPPSYPQPGHEFSQQPTQYGQPGQFPAGPPGAYGQQYPSTEGYGQPAQYAPPGAQYGEVPAAFGEAAPGKGSRSSLAIIGGIVGVLAVIIVAAFCVTAFWKPGFLVTTKLDVSKAQTGVQQILTDQTNGYGVKSADNVKCNNGQNPTVKKGDTFTCDVSVDGQHKQVTVTFQDNNGTYEVGRPK
jgi:hypothetical protein